MLWFTEEDDFSLPGNITVPAGATLPRLGIDCLFFTASDDGKLEGSEMFTIRIDGTDNPGLFVGSVSTTTITINDNLGMYQKRNNVFKLRIPKLIFIPAAGEVQFNTTSITVDEGSSEMICVILESANANTLEIDIMIDLELQAGIIMNFTTPQLKIICFLK